MTPMEPTDLRDGHSRVTFAKDQPPYLPLPTTVSPDGLVLTEWQPTEEELDALLLGGRIRIQIHTFNHSAEDWKKRPMQPLQVDVLQPECGMRES